MNRPRIAALGIALASIATTASAAVAYYPEGYVVYNSAPVVRVERVSAPEVVTYNDRYVYYTTTESPRIVERYIPSSNTLVVQADPVIVTGPRYYQAYPSAHYDPRHPHWGHLIDHGLFNRKGPTDFGR